MQKAGGHQLGRSCAKSNDAAQVDDASSEASESESEAASEYITEVSSASAAECGEASYTDASSEL